MPECEVMFELLSELIYMWAEAAHPVIYENIKNIHVYQYYVLILKIFDELFKYQNIFAIGLINNKSNDYFCKYFLNINFKVTFVFY